MKKFIGYLKNLIIEKDKEYVIYENKIHDFLWCDNINKKIEPIDKELLELQENVKKVCSQLEILEDIKKELEIYTGNKINIEYIKYGEYRKLSNSL